MELVKQAMSLGPMAPVPDAPSWDAPWIDPVLHALLWRPGHSVWWLVDPTRAAQRARAKPLEAATCPQRVPSDAIDASLTEVGPRLIGPIQSFFPGRIERMAFGELWGHGAGILISAPSAEADSRRLADHLARWMRRPLEGSSAQVFVRFWQPDVLGAWIEQAAGPRIDRVAPFFAGPFGPLRLVSEAPDGGALVWTAQDPAAGRVPAIDAIEIEAMNLHRRRRYCRGAMAWIVRTWGMRAGASADVLASVAARQMDALDAVGIRSEYATNYAIAGLYLLGRGMDELEPDLRAILTDQALPQKHRAEAFLTEVQERTGYRPLAEARNG